MDYFFPLITKIPHWVCKIGVDSINDSIRKFILNKIRGAPAKGIVNMVCFQSIW